MADKIVVMKDGFIEQIGTPEEIYFHPQTEFVASFISKANIIEGSWSGDYFTPTHAPYSHWYYPNVADSFKLSGVCPIRPEQLQLSENTNGLCGRVKNLLFQGREVSCIVTVEGKEVHFVTDIQNYLKIGDRVTLNITNH